MSSYPSAALAIKPPEQPDLLGNFLKIQQLRNMQQQGQIGQQQLQAGELENQQRQMDIDSQRAFTRAYQESGGDPNATAQLAAKYGAKPQALQAWQTAQIGLQKELEGLHESKLKNVAAGYDLLARQTSAILQLPPDKRLPAVQQGIQQMAQQGAIPP